MLATEERERAADTSRGGRDGGGVGLEVELVLGLGLVGSRGLLVILGVVIGLEGNGV
jgi:hypothetical protein